MNILFLTIAPFPNIESHSLYPDLLRHFRNQGHSVYTISPYERRTQKSTECVKKQGVVSLHVKIGNITQCGLIEKGISTLLIERNYEQAIKKYFSNVHFELVLYSTPPITFARVVDYVRQRDNAKTYLVLKDIFPQNAVDIGMLSKSGLRGLAYRYFRKKEKELYRISDYIGCLSPANVDYLLHHNPEIEPDRVEVCPNAIEPLDKGVTTLERQSICQRYGIPLDKTVFVYGGNLGRPQGIDFMLRCIHKEIENAYFLIVGDGTEYEKIAAIIEKECPSHIRLMKGLPKDEYDTMIGACDVGLIFLDYRFTIPNFPSRLLSYMQAHLPVLACTDSNTDVGEVIVDGGFGWWCPSNDVNGFIETVQVAMRANRKAMGENAWNYLKERYDVKIAYKTIMSHFAKEQSMDV